jgi:hypothetical protein
MGILRILPRQEKLAAPGGVSVKVVNDLERIPRLDTVSLLVAASIRSRQRS